MDTVWAHPEATAGGLLPRSQGRRVVPTPRCIREKVHQAPGGHPLAQPDVPREGSGTPGLVGSLQGCLMSLGVSPTPNEGGKWREEGGKR